MEESLGDLEEEFAYDADAGPSYAAPRLGVQGVRAAANTFAEELAKSLQTPCMKRPLQALQQEAYELSVRGRRPQPVAGRFPDLVVHMMLNSISSIHADSSVRNSHWNHPGT